MNGSKQIEISSSLVILSIKKFVLNMKIEFCITEVDISLLLLMCCEEPSFVGCFLYGKARTQVLGRLALLF
jgi:hypothetical protein